jgi:hypothetical protein
MAGEQKPNFPPDDEAGGTMIGIGRINAPTPQPREDEAPESGRTMVGIGRVAPPPSAPAQQADGGGTMVGIPVARPGAFGGAPNFGNMAMPLAAPRAVPAAAAPPEAGGTLVGMRAIPTSGFPPPPPAAPETGGTMVGIGRINVPSPFGAPPPAMPAEGGTMVGIGRLNVPGAFGAPAPAATVAGGTMVGMARIGMPPPAAQEPDVGGTMVGIGRVGAPPPAASVPDVGGTMVGISPAAFRAPQASFAQPQRPSGPPPDYEIISHLGGGELGQVFHARHRGDGSEVAIRIVRPEIAAVPGALEALRDVVAMATGAEHTHLGKLFALDESASPTLILEYVPGKPLMNLMRERGAAPAAAVIDLGVRLCSALAAAHASGLAHGRLHAGNVVLEAKSGRWVMLDLAQTYAVQSLEPAHDLYALGALLYEMATGRGPFEDGTDTAPDPRTHKANLPASLSALLMRALAPNPAVWFPSAIEFAQALARARNLP